MVQKMGMILSEREEKWRRKCERNGELEVEEEEILREDPLVAVRNTNRDQRFSASGPRRCRPREDLWSRFVLRTATKAPSRMPPQLRHSTKDPLVTVRNGTGTNGPDGWPFF